MAFTGNGLRGDAANRGRMWLGPRKEHGQKTDNCARMHQGLPAGVTGSPWFSCIELVAGARNAPAASGRLSFERRLKHLRHRMSLAFEDEADGSSSSQVWMRTI